MLFSWIITYFATVTATSLSRPDQGVLKKEDVYLIELAPGKTKWVTEEEKWSIRRV